MAISRRTYTPDQLLAAQAGALTRGNTQTGTPQRQAVYRSEVLARQARAEAEGLSTRAALGHAKAGEATATDFRQAAQGGASIEALRRVAVARSQLFFKDKSLYPLYDEETTTRNILKQTDREWLQLMSVITVEGWRSAADHRVKGNPFFYHHELRGM